MGLGVKYWTLLTKLVDYYIFIASGHLGTILILRNQKDWVGGVQSNSAQEIFNLSVQN